MPKMSRQEIEERIEEAKRQVPKGSRWVHYKHPDADHVYIVTGVSLLVTGDEAVIVHYRPLYFDVAQVEFSRTFEEWQEMVNTPAGPVPRFQRFVDPV